MNEVERKEFFAFIEEFEKKITSSQEAARQFLVDVGIYTMDGQLTEPYKYFRMPARTTTN